MSGVRSIPHSDIILMVNQLAAMIAFSPGLAVHLHLKFPLPLKVQKTVPLISLSDLYIVEIP
jgi:hypothetical protein